jgi:transcriptional regulator with XRE-family HTH domain
MKIEEKLLSRKLRQKGYSLNEICDKTGFTKSSVSLWVRNIELTTEQKQRLSKKGLKKEDVEKRRLTRLAKENARREIIVNQAEKEINGLSQKDLFIIGIILYWAEGRKAARGAVTFSNSDPRAIKTMMRFFREICGVPNDKFRAHIHIHQHLDVKAAETYWSDITQIPLTQFFKTYRKPNKSSLGKKDTLPHGTFDIYVCSTELFLKIKGWINGICKNLNIS